MRRTRRSSLRTESIVSTALLVGAALVFVAMLLIRLGENERLSEQVGFYVSQSRMLGHAMAQLDSDVDRAQLLQLFAHEMDLRSALLGADSLHLSAGNWPTTQSAQAQARQMLRRALLGSELVLEVNYPSSWLKFGADDVAGLQVALKLRTSGVGRQALYLSFSLEQIRARTFEQLRLALWICLGYGLVLVLTAVHLLRRAVIAPVEELTAVTDALMRGHAEARVVPAGPREIATLGCSFNQMAATLEQNQTELQYQLEALRDKNHELQATRLSLMQTARMASVGHLASGMAHEIGNPLSAVLAYLDLARHQSTADTQADLLQRAEIEASRIDHIIRDMLDYASAEQMSAIGGECYRSDPLEVIQQTCDLLEHQGVFKQRNLNLNLPAELPLCCIPEHHLQQILVNLLLNARAATSVNDTFAITASSGNETVEIVIEDNGLGMTQTQQQAAFDPFFSVGKPSGRGLGLYVCYQQLSQSGGDIVLTSTPGQGSCFKVILRRA
ncbi:MAG: HAMP domain-containing sensor histidine kinase [Desulfuromonadaceae bacterium]|nr:HAMP domain-containing sensor histidine kinase [Desulfuromonas sp.]MDY0186090.1 HAMP domain-containing sensor histidine kinase [Desulfuromonadaceae bacterium]